MQRVLLSRHMPWKKNGAHMGPSQSAYIATENVENTYSAFTIYYTCSNSEQHPTSES